MKSRQPVGTAQRMKALSTDERNYVLHMITRLQERLNKAREYLETDPNENRTAIAPLFDTTRFEAGQVYDVTQRWEGDAPLKQVTQYVKYNRMRGLQ